MTCYPLEMSRSSARIANASAHNPRSRKLARQVFARGPPTAAALSSTTVITETLVVR